MVHHRSMREGQTQRAGTHESERMVDSSSLFLYSERVSHSHKHRIVVLEKMLGAGYALPFVWRILCGVKIVHICVVTAGCCPPSLDGGQQRAVF